MAQNGVFCLEGEWWDDYKRPTSVEPALQLLKATDGWRVPYIHRNVATVQEFEFYIEKWLLKKHANYPILYLAFHGESGTLCVGDQRKSNGRIGLDWFQDKIDGQGHGRMLYFGSCATMDIHGNRVNGFLKSTKLEGVIGYRDYVDWIDSTTMDTFLLSRLGTRKLTPSTIVNVYDQAREKMRGLHDELNLKAAARPKKKVIKIRKAPMDIAA